jgi:peptidoglycan/LPS O-acetylase OafA/YrhL
MRQGRLTYRYFGFFRFGLALLVAFHHFGANLGPPWARAFSREWTPGTVAVFVFFCLSGFIMVEAIRTLYVRRPAAFAMNRALRIAVPFAVCLGVSIVVHLVILRFHGTIRGLPAANVFTLANIAENLWFLYPFSAGPEYNFLPIIWAIRYEVEFYTVCWLLVLLSRGRPRLFDGLMLVPILTTLAFAVAANFTMLIGPEGKFITALCAFFALGVCMLYALEGSALYRALVVVWVALCLHGYLCINPSVTGGAAVEILSLLAGLLALMWLLATVDLPRFRALDRAFGDLSYPLYLLHFPIIFAVEWKIPGETNRLVAGLAISVAAAIAFVRLVEPPLTRLRDAIRGVPLTSPGPRGWEPEGANPPRPRERVPAQR